MRAWSSLFCVSAFALGVSACSDGGGSGSGTTAQGYSVGGTMSWPAGVVLDEGLELQLNGQDVPISYFLKIKKTFTLKQALPSGSAYTVTIKRQPDGMVCQVSNGSGIAPTTAVHIACANWDAASAAVSTVAGLGVAGYTDGAARSAAFNRPSGIAVDSKDNVYVADTENHRIRKITPEGVVSTFAGSGTAALTNGNGTHAAFNRPLGLVFDPDNNLLVADSGNHAVRKITPAGEVSTVVGNGSPTSNINSPSDLAISPIKGGYLVYMTDTGNHAVRYLNDKTGVLFDHAGSGVSGNSNGALADATFMSPWGIAAAPSGTLYAADKAGQRVRSVGSNNVETYAGSGSTGLQNGAGASAQFNSPSGLRSDQNGNLYVADSQNHSIRIIHQGGTVQTLAGNGNSGTTDGAGTTANFITPNAVAQDSLGNLWVTDSDSHTIRKISRK